MKDEKFTKRYTKPFLNETVTGEDAHPKYRRRSPEQGGFTAKMQIRGNEEIQVNNQLVVLYNPLLPKMFNASINVEYCSSIKSIKRTWRYRENIFEFILAEIRANKEIVLALASSGIVATLTDGVRRAHSRLKLPLNVADHEFSVCDITKSLARGQILKQCKATIWDESTMAHRKSLKALNRTL
ncbi:hypothetical protein EVAR_49213_1 [Eumeta japonica]|uniref:ATP-dependent DNA helicase n=1 Tax=Eumeta variegata TaxID=151549 RepID=A0A4C1XRV9_EUMVA|nr:hypothetical protein EVAR_49213_1 [Eumeta japonica]